MIGNAWPLAVVTCFFAVGFAVAANGVTPAGFKDFKWGAPPNKSLKLYMPSTDEGVTMYVPVSSKRPEPLFDIPIAEEAYGFVHGKFYQGNAYIDGAANLQKMRNALVTEFGNPSFTNDKLKIWRWKWPKKGVDIQLFYEEKFARTTVTFTNSVIN
jgi:hypothetical protein